MMRLIEHLQQTLPDNCVSTCLAMIVGKSVEDVTAEFHADYHADTMLPSQYLRQHGLVPKRCFTEEISKLEHNCVHVVTVPSLNVRGCLHNILIVREGNDVVHVLDPNLGREGKASYDSWPLDTWWMVDLSIEHLQLVNHRDRLNGYTEDFSAAPMVSFEQSQNNEQPTEGSAS